MKRIALFFFTLLTLNCFGAGLTVSSLNGLATNLTVFGTGGNVVSTNDVGGTNQTVKILNGGGTGTFGPLSNLVANIAGQLAISTAASSVAQVAIMRSLTKGDFKYGMSFPAGIAVVGDPQLMDSNIQSVTIYLNGNPTVQTTNQTGDYTLNVANMAVFGSGSGFNCDIVTNDASGTPHVYSQNSVQFMYVPTNAPPTQNRSNLFGGYHGVIANYSSINKGFIVGGPSALSGDTGSPNHYGFAYLARDSANTALYRFVIPVQQANVSVPDDTNNVSLLLADELNTNITILGGLKIQLNQVAPNSGTAGLNIGSMNGTNAIVQSDVYGSTLNVGSTFNTVGQANFFRYRINADGSAGNASVYNGSGDGLWVFSTGTHVTGLAVQGVGEIYCGLAGVTVSNNVTVSSNLTVVGTVSGNGSGLTNLTAVPDRTFSTNTIYFKTNTAPVTVLAKAATLGASFSNDQNTRASWTGTFVLTDAVGGQPILVISNLTTGWVLTNAFPQGIGAAATITVTTPVTSPSDSLNAYDASTGTGASVAFVRGFWTKQ